MSGEGEVKRLIVKFDDGVELAFHGDRHFWSHFLSGQTLIVEEKGSGRRWAIPFSHVRYIIEDKVRKAPVKVGNHG